MASTYCPNTYHHKKAGRSSRIFTTMTATSLTGPTETTTATSDPYAILKVDATEFTDFSEIA